MASYRFDFTRLARRHLRALSKPRSAQAIEAITRYLTYDPNVATGKRKQLRENALAQYRLRVGDDLRVYSDVLEADRVVLIKAVVIKDRGRMMADGEDIEL